MGLVATMLKDTFLDNQGYCPKNCKHDKQTFLKNKTSQILENV